MATFKSRISGPGSPYDLVLVVNQGSQSVSGNYSNVSWELYIQKISGWGYWANGTYSWSVNIGGVSRSGSGNSYNFENYSKLTLGSGSVRINHNSNGSKSISASGRWNGLGSLNATNVSGTLGLKTIPRESKITSLSVSSRTTNSITYSWSADKTVSQISYRHSGGSWNTVNASGTSGSFTVGGLSPGKSITVELQVKNRDSGLWSSSSTRSGTTYKEATPTNAPGFTITPGGSTNVTVNISRENSNIKSIVTVEYWGDNQTWNLLYESGRVDTSAPIALGSGHMNTLLSNRRSSKTVTIRYRVDSYWGWSGGKQGSSKYSSQTTATISSAAGPTIGNLSYEDTNSNTVGITSNNKIIIQNHSHLGVTASGATARYHSSLTKIVLTVAGKSGTHNLSGTSMGARTINVGTINSAGSSTATMTVTDSRGFTASKSITIQGEPYQNPTIVSLVPKRKFGYEEPSYVTGTIRISKIAGNNKAEFRYRIRPVGGSWGTYQVIDLGKPGNWGNLLQYTFDSFISEYPNDKEYDVEGQVKDRLTGWTNTTYGKLPKGIPLMKFTEKKVEVGVDLEVIGTTISRGRVYQRGKSIEDFNTHPNVLGVINFNDYWKHGVWVISKSANVANSNNRPTTHAGRLEVYTLGDYTNTAITTPWLQTWQIFTDLYGIKHYRHMGTGASGSPEWSPWKRELSDHDVKDYVIEDGKNYKKWASGKMEAWGTAADKTNASGDIRIPYGVKFARAPESIVMTERWNSTHAWKGTPHGQNTEAFNVRCMHMSNGTVYAAGYAHTVWFYVVGEWK